jgi:iron complex transport system permease protein
MKLNKYRLAWLVGIAAMLLAFILNLQFGSVPLSFKEVLTGLRSFNNEEVSMTSIIGHYCRFGACHGGSATPDLNQK